MQKVTCEIHATFPIDFFKQKLENFVNLNPHFRYQVIPYGNYSYVKVLADDKVLPLYGSGGFRMIFDTKVRLLKSFIEAAIILKSLLTYWKF